MKNTEMLNQIKTLLNIEVKLEEMKLENGTLISAESFEKDKEIFIITDDESKEKVALPKGDYSLEDGRILVIETEGIISDIKEKIEEKIEDKEEVVEESEETEDLEEVKEEEVVEEEKEEETELYATKEELGKVVDMIEEIKAMIDGKEDMSKESPLKSRTVKEEFSEELPEEVKTELSEPSAKPIKHNPESETAKTKVQFGKSKMGATAMERVLNRLNK
jgi:hypothetical protein